MSFSVTFSSNLPKWLKYPRERWNAGLTGAGVSWRQGLQQANQPSIDPSSTYQRTNTLADKSNYAITELGRSMDLMSTYYLTYLLFGTGIFGYKGTPIRPVNARFLAWQATANFAFEIGPSGGVKQTGRGMWIRAKEVKGTIWPGKKEELVASMRDSFLEGVKSYEE